MNKTVLTAGLIAIAAFPALKQGHAAPLLHASAQSAAPQAFHSASVQRDWRTSLNEKVTSLAGNLSRNASRLIAPLVRSANGHAHMGHFPAAAQVGAQEAGSKRTAGKPAGMRAVPADAGKDSYQDLAARAAGFGKLDPGKPPRAAALYLGDSCTAAPDVCKQFAAEVTKDKIASVTEVNGMRPAAGMKLKLRYKF